MNDDDRDELQQLRREMESSSLGDRPSSMAAGKLGRLIRLEAQEASETKLPFCRVCKSHHRLTASECRAMDGIA